jgi:hypothetical protein
MAITANAGVDVAYVFTDLPVASVALAGSGTPHAGAINSYTWQVIGYPAGATPVITAPTSQNTTLTGVTVAGDYVVGLAVTDTGGNASSSDWKTMDDTAVKVISVAMESGIVKVSEKQKGWITKYAAFMDTVDAALGRLAPIPVEVAGSAVTNVAAETAFASIVAIATPAADDWVKVEFFVNVVVDGTDGCILRWRVAPAAGDLVADGEILQELTVSASGTVFVEMALHVSAIGAVLDGAAVDSVSSFRTSAAMPASVFTEVQSGISLDITGDLQMGLTLEDSPTWGASSSATIPKVLGGRNNNRRI